jgi:hypothetical protein
LLRAPADVAGGRIALELAKVAGESDLLFIGDVLLAEYENGVLVHPRLDRHHLLGVQRAAAVDPGDLAGKHRMQWTDRNGHRGLLPDDRLLLSYQASDIASDY